MLKQILNLDGAQELSRKEQKTINGGKRDCILALAGPNPCPGSEYSIYCERIERCCRGYC